MIVERDGGWTLRCTGCGAGVELSLREMSNPERKLQRKEAMKLVHDACDTFKTPEQAKAAMKLRRAASR